MKRPVTLSDILHGHAVLDIECLDRIYLNGYIPVLQTAGQVVGFLHHRGFPIRRRWSRHWISSTTCP